MDTITQFLLDYGYWGMFVSAILAGSVLPFSSEAVLIGLLSGGLEPVPLLISASIGNIIGGMLNYVAGRMGRMEWIEKYLHVKQSSIDRAERFMSGRGALMGFFAFVPVIGSAITVVLGLTRANLLITIISVSVGKVLRYALMIWGAELFA